MESPTAATEPGLAVPGRRRLRGRASRGRAAPGPAESPPTASQPATPRTAAATTARTARERWLGFRIAGDPLGRSAVCVQMCPPITTRGSSRSTRRATVHTRTSVLPGEWRAFQRHRDRRYVTLLAPPHGSLAINVAARPPPSASSHDCPALPGGPGDDTWSSVRALRAARAVPARRVGRRGVLGTRVNLDWIRQPAAPGTWRSEFSWQGSGGHGLQARLRAARLAPAALRGHRRALPHRRGRALQLHPRPRHLPRRHRHPRRHPHPRGPAARRPGPLPARRDATWRPRSPSSSASPGTTSWSPSGTRARAPRCAGCTRSSERLRALLGAPLERGCIDRPDAWADRPRTQTTCGPHPTRVRATRVQAMLRPYGTPAPRCARRSRTSRSARRSGPRGSSRASPRTMSAFASASGSRFSTLMVGGAIRLYSARTVATVSTPPAPPSR